VAEKFLDRPDIVAGLQEMGGEAMSQGVTARGLRDAGFPDGLLDRPLQGLLVDVMAALDARAWVDGALGGWKDILPPFLRERNGTLAPAGRSTGRAESPPLPPGARILPGEGEGQVHIAETFFKVLLISRIPSF
jgi:hypothetical protein